MDDSPSEQGSILFDENHELRIFDPEKYKQSTTLQQEADSFGHSMLFVFSQRY